MLSVTLLLSGTHAIADTPRSAASAGEEMASVESQAAAGHKNILLTFSASWCGNCRLFDRFAADPAIHPILEKFFVFADLDTGERSSDKQHTNIPGGEQVQVSLGGKDAGFPYIVMLDPAGKRITDSRRPNGKGMPENIGYPDAPEEIDWFMAMLKKAAPSMSTGDTATVRSWLKAHSSR